MSASPPDARVHRILGCAAVLHGGLLLFLPSFADDGWMSWTVRLWVGLATLWFFWPLILALYPGRSARRVFVPLILVTPCVFLWFRLYSSVFASPVFGLPDGVDLNPISVSEYAVSYGAGRIEAKKDAKAGRLNLEAFGFGTFTPGAPNFSEAVLKQYQIEVTHVAGCVVNSRIIGHAQGYNDVMIEQIKLRAGPAVVKAAQDEDARWARSYDDGVAAGREDARRDIREGRLAIEVSNPPKNGDADFERMLRERYQMEFRRVDPHADAKMANNVLGHANGYNEIIQTEVQRRFGDKTVEAIWKSFYDSRGKD
jgi:hypothetical protein